MMGFIPKNDVFVLEIKKLKVQNKIVQHIRERSLTLNA